MKEITPQDLIADISTHMPPDGEFMVVEWPGIGRASDIKMAIVIDKPSANYLYTVCDLIYYDEDDYTLDTVLQDPCLDTAVRRMVDCVANRLNSMDESKARELETRHHIMMQYHRAINHIDWMCRKERHPWMDDPDEAVESVV